jgi:hypothetical protein
MKEVIYKRISELKSKPMTPQIKLEIQKLQQMLDASENLNKNNSANSLTLKAK